MLSTFYKKYGLRLLLLSLAALPVFHFYAEAIPSNNDIEAWLPEKSEVRQTYEEFKIRFGAEEVILIGLDANLGDELIESVAGRVERLSGVRHCWTPQRMREVMHELSVKDVDIAQRLSGLFISRDAKRIGAVVMLSDHGIRDRAGTVADIRQVLKYCQLDGHAVNIAGAPVVIAELNRLGGRESNKVFFFISLAICAGLVYYQLRDWSLTGMILGLTVFAIQGTVSILRFCGGEMNFVLDALPVMVMVFTLEVSVHVLHYYESLDEADPDRIGTAFRMAFWPCFLAAFTSAIGMWSLCASSFVPVRQFGGAGALGSVMAFLVGALLTPAVIAVCPPRRSITGSSNHWFELVADWLLVRSRQVVVVGAVAVLCLGTGLFSLRSHLEPLGFFPKDNIVLRDVQRIRAELTNTDTIEATVDFGKTPELASLPFVAKLRYVQELETKIAAHPGILHTMSLSTLFPKEMPTGLELTQLLSRAQKRQSDNDFLAGGEQYWRISAHIRADQRGQQEITFAELRELVGDAPITFTGIAPLIEKAQQDIYEGFWSSFVWAFWSIMLVFIIAMRSVKAGFIGMLPNLAPIAVVFGFLGWIDCPVDIGMMMSGSIAMGIAVDGAFHFLVCYRAELLECGDRAQATREAYLKTGPPIFNSTMIMAIAMLALTFSSFGPTAQFGWLMAATLLATQFGDLVLLPCLLGFFHTKRLAELAAKSRPLSGVPLQGPHFWRWLRSRKSLRIFRATDEDPMT
ncbi:MAG: MMPL family transporter [Planctomycetaceae bacterium]|nr:MMPL family transporter [Planctomycetaceae bacterium]